jgi:hypothetical protein
VKQRAKLRLCTLWSVFQVGSRSYVSQDHQRLASQTGHVEAHKFLSYLATEPEDRGVVSKEQENRSQGTLLYASCVSLLSSTSTVNLCCSS